jgi:AraC-like DNA-binding protein
VAQIEELLLGTSNSIGQIAEILGFPSPEHVALYFRSVKGMNPHTFRARHACR